MRKRQAKKILKRYLASHGSVFPCVGNMMKAFNHIRRHGWSIRYCTTRWRINWPSTD